MSESAAPSPSTPGPGISPFAAVAGIFSKPGETFSRLLAAPTWWLPFLLWMAAGVLVTFVVVPKLDMERSLREQMERRGQQVSEQQVRQQAEVMAKMPWIVPVSAGVMSLLAFFVAGLVLWGGAKAFGAEAGFGQILALWSHAALPNVLAGLLAIPLFAFQPDGSMTQQAAQRFVKSNPAAFLPDDASPALVAVLGAVDVFSIATIALLVIGFRRLPGVSKASATAVPIVLWVVYVLLKAGWAAVFG